MFFLHAGESEVGGFGVCSAHGPLYVQDFVTVRQLVTPMSVEFVDAAVADYFDRCVDAGLRPERFGRIWCHTHPGDSPTPSVTDEKTFARVFGGCDWAVMFIVSRTHRTYARLSFAAGPGGDVLLDVAVDWQFWPHLLLELPEQLQNPMLAWAQEYEQNIHSAWPTDRTRAAQFDMEPPQGWWDFEEYELRPDVDELRPDRDEALDALPQEGTVPA